jgi:RNA polymerase sigma factor (sigma-70 family)
LVALSSVAPPNGQELLSEFMQYGRQGPFEEIVRRYAGMVFNVCLRVTKDKHDAEDATQAVFLTLAIQARRGTQIKALGPWLQQVAKRLSLDLRRSKGRRKVREERHQIESVQRHNNDGDSLPLADLDEIKIILHEELNKLPSKYRLPLILHYFGGLSREEMAAELGCKPSTLGVRIFRGREMLAGRLNGRGINMSSGTFAVAMAYTVRSAVSHAMISTTSHAASALAVGHDGIGLVSSRVIGLSRRAAGALVIGKVKLVTTVLILACASLGTGAKAFGMLPKIDIGQIISEQVMRLIRPLAQPLTSPRLTDASSIKTNATIQLASNSPIAMPTLSVGDHWPVAKPSSAGVSSSTALSAISTSVARSAPYFTNFGPSAQPQAHAAALSDSPIAASTATTPQRATSSAQEPTLASSSGHSSSAGADVQPGPRPERAVASNVPAGFVFTGLPVITGSSAHDLFVSPSSKHTGSILTVSAGPRSTPGNPTITLDNTSAVSATVIPSNASIVRVPAEGGTVINSAGLLSGYGQVDLTGTLDVCGQVVANGQGIDRTLNLTSFQSIRDGTGSSENTPPMGWYAENHGRLSLRLQSSKTDSSLTWGEDPTDASLQLVNAVRMSQIQSAGDKTPSQLSLMSTDRQDVPSFSTLMGTPIGLWEVDPSIGDIASAQLTIHYDDAAIIALADTDSSVQLWTLGSGSWQTVDPASLVVNTSDNMISGLGQDFNYFAVTVPPGNGTDISNLIAVPQSQMAPSIDSVPEPVGMTAIVLTAGLLARRRRR